MTPFARAAAAITVLDQILAGTAAEPALLGWSRASRFAGSGDRAAVRDLVFDALRRRRSRAALGGADTGRGLILGWCREAGIDPDSLFGAGPHAPALLTAAERDAGQMPDADEATDLPGWLLPDLRCSLGADFPAVAAALRERAPVWLRVNRLKGTPAEAVAALAAEGIGAEPTTLCDGALCVVDGARGIARSRAYAAGLVELQDLSPQRAAAALGDLSGLTVLDFCAGGGGKALALAAAGAAQVTAHDADPRRMADLPARAARAGAKIVLAAPGAVHGQFDLVVADVPCSGSGTWRRDPGGRWRLSRARLDQLTTIQAGILQQALGFVRPGGRIAYMTCSLLEAENGAQIAACLAAGQALTEEQRLSMTPLDGGGDGFFLSVLKCYGVN